MTRREEFEADLTAVFGDRGEEFAGTLREHLYQLWREGEKRGAKGERDRQADSLKGYKGKNIAPDEGTMQHRLREMAAPHPTPEDPKKDTRSTFGKVLAGDEPILKVPKEKFPTVTVPDFMLYTEPQITATDLRELYGTFKIPVKKTKL
jgi:hypothetical protein